MMDSTAAVLGNIAPSALQACIRLCA